MSGNSGTTVSNEVDAPEIQPTSAVDPEQILVGIPALNEAGFIENTIRSLLVDAPEMRRVRIVVADGGSTDGTQEIVTRLKEELPNVELIENKARLQSAGVNLVAMTRAGPKHTILVRCDAHSTYTPRYVLRVAESLLAHDASALVTPLDSTGKSCFQRAASWVANTKLGSGGAAHRAGRRSGYVDHGYHAGFRLDWFRRVGGYDESFSHNEDAELDHRIIDSGGRIWLDADIRLNYEIRPNIQALGKQYWRYGRGRARNVLKHRIVPQLRQWLPVVNFVGIVLCLLLAAVEAAFLVWPLAYIALIVGVSLTALITLRSVCGLWAGPAVGTMHLCWGAGFTWQLLKSLSEGAVRREQVVADMGRN